MIIYIIICDSSKEIYYWTRTNKFVMKITVSSKDIQKSET